MYSFSAYILFCQMTIFFSIFTILPTLFFILKKKKIFLLKWFNLIIGLFAIYLFSKYFIEVRDTYWEIENQGLKLIESGLKELATLNFINYFVIILGLINLFLTYFCFRRHKSN